MDEITVRRNSGFSFLSGQPPIPSWIPYLTQATASGCWPGPSSVPLMTPEVDAAAGISSAIPSEADLRSLDISPATMSPSESTVTSTTSIQDPLQKEDGIIVRPQPVIPNSPLAVTFDPFVAIKALEANPMINKAISSRLSRRPRSEKKPIPDDMKDDKYYERRKRNNLAAKKSRDARKAREDQIAFRACLLEKENAVLRAQVAILREEGYWLRHLLSQRRPQRPC